MRLSHNIPSLNIYTKYSSVLVDQSKAMKNISTGVRVNSAMDDPNAIAEDDNFNMQLRGLQMSSQNAQDGVSLLQTAQGGLDGMNSMLQRIRELAVQANNSTNDSSDKASIQIEINKLVDGVDNLAKSTNINGVYLLNSDDPSKSITTMIGANAGDNMEIPTFNLEASNLKDSSGNSLRDLDVTTEAGSEKALGIIDSAMQTISSANSKYGALQNRFNTVISNTSEINIQLQSADSDVMDVDVASETMRYSKDSILVQAGIAMMAQTNKMPQDVLNILKGVK